MARGYDFVNVCHWFAERADLILLLFDAHKLDISDEFKAVIERLKGQDDKIRVILNKADQVSRRAGRRLPSGNQVTSPLGMKPQLAPRPTFSGVFRVVEAHSCPPS